MSLITPSLHMDLKNPEITALVCKALSSEVRLKILDLLTDYPKIFLIWLIYWIFQCPP